MDNESKIIKDAEKLLNKNGLTLPELVQLFGKHKSTTLMLDGDSYSKFENLYNRIDSGKPNIQEKGKILEELTSVLFQQKGRLLDCCKNCRTSTNEIDLLLSWSEEARLAGYNKAFPCFGDSFLCECKNYNRKVSVTYVGKFCSLMLVTSNKMGIMISWDGISGRGSWNDSKGLIKKLALKEDMYIITIDKFDLEQIYRKKDNIFSIVQGKYIALKNEIDFSKYLIKHEAENKMN